MSFFVDVTCYHANGMEKTIPVDKEDFSVTTKHLDIWFPRAELVLTLLVGNVLKVHVPFADPDWTVEAVIGTVRVKSRSQLRFEIPAGKEIMVYLNHEDEVLRRRISIKNIRTSPTLDSPSSGSSQGSDPASPTAEISEGSAGPAPALLAAEISEGSAGPAPALLDPRPSEGSAAPVPVARAELSFPTEYPEDNAENVVHPLSAIISEGGQECKRKVGGVSLLDCGFDLDAIGVPDDAIGHVYRKLKSIRDTAPPGKTVYAHFNMNYQPPEINKTTVQLLGSYSRSPNPYWSLHAIGERESVEIARRHTAPLPDILIENYLASRTSIFGTANQLMISKEVACTIFANGSLTRLLSVPQRTTSTVMEIDSNMCIVYNKTTVTKTGVTYKPEYIFIFKTPAEPAAKRARLGDGGA